MVKPIYGFHELFQIYIVSFNQINYYFACTNKTYGIFQLASDGICRDYSQSYLDHATYTFEQKNGEEIVKQVKEKLSDYFNKKKRAAEVNYVK